MSITHKPGIMSSAVKAGFWAALTSLAPVVVLGRKNTGHWSPGPNAVSHWLWGSYALKKVGFTFRHTVIGLGTHYLASLFWSSLFAWMSGTSTKHVWRNAAGVSALACLVDYKLTPQRFTPGYEHHLSKKDLFVVHACLAAGLALSQKSPFSRKQES